MGPFIRPRCIGAVRSLTQHQSINQSMPCRCGGGDGGMAPDILSSAKFRDPAALSSVKEPPVPIELGAHWGPKVHLGTLVKRKSLASASNVTNHNSSIV